MNPVTLNDLGDFLSNILNANSDYLFLAFTLMIASAVLVLTRRLLVGVKI